MIGANIRKLRVQHGMTQKNLADKLFVSAQAVSRWENDEVEPSIGTITELAKIFGVTADEILGIEAKEAQKNEEEKEDSKQQKKEEPVRQVLAVCEKCNNPIYESNEIVRKNGAVWCRACVGKKEESDRILAIENARKKRIYSFVFGTLATVISLIITIYSWNTPFFDAKTRAWAIVLSISMFTFVSCCILDNNFVGDMFISVSKWSIKAPGLIFTFDLDGCLWFIGMKILFAILGFLLGIVMFLLALVIGGLVSIFVYPYAIIMNIKRPDYD